MNLNPVLIRRKYRKETGKSNRIYEGKGGFFDEGYVFWLEDELIKRIKNDKQE